MKFGFITLILLSLLCIETNAYNDLNAPCGDLFGSGRSKKYSGTNGGYAQSNRSWNTNTSSPANSNSGTSPNSTNSATNSAPAQPKANPNVSNDEKLIAAYAGVPVDDSVDPKEYLNFDVPFNYYVNGRNLDGIATIKVSFGVIKKTNQVSVNNMAANQRRAHVTVAIKVIHYGLTDVIKFRNETSVFARSSDEVVKVIEDDGGGLIIVATTKIKLPSRNLNTNIQIAPEILKAPDTFTLFLSTSGAAWNSSFLLNLQPDSRGLTNYEGAIKSSNLP